MKENYLEDFISFMKEEDLSNGTIHNYIFLINKFIQYFNDNIANFSLEKVKKIDIIDYRTFLIKNDYSANYVNNSLASLKKYFTFISSISTLENPASKVKKIKIANNYYEESLSLKDFKKIRREIYIASNSKDKLIFDILSNTGLRKSELINLKIKDIFINDRSGHLIIKIGKGMKNRKVPLNSYIRSQIVEYLNNHESNSEYLISNAGTGKRLNSSTINKMLSKYSEKANIKLHPHNLRHFFADQYLKANQFSQTSLISLQNILGHQNITTTMNYLSAQDDDDSIENLKF